MGQARRGSRYGVDPSNVDLLVVRGWCLHMQQYVLLNSLGVPLHLLRSSSFCLSVGTVQEPCPESRSLSVALSISNAFSRTVNHLQLSHFTLCYFLDYLLAKLLEQLKSIKRGNRPPKWLLTTRTMDREDLLVL